MNYPTEFAILKHIVRLYIHRICGAENIPQDKSLIVAANHTSYMDIFIVPYLIIKYTDRMFSSLVNSRFFKNPLFRYFLHRYQAIPISVSKDTGTKSRKSSNKQAFQRANKMAEKKLNIMIFPEGNRSPTGKIQKGRTGVAKLALMLRAPVIPIGISGAYDILPKGAIIPKFKRADINIGKPMHFEKYYGKKITKKLLRTITDQIMREIARLSGQRYEA